MSLTAYRCPDCGRLLFKSDAPAGVVQTRCDRCEAIKLIAVKALDRPPERAHNGPGRIA